MIPDPGTGDPSDRSAYWRDGLGLQVLEGESGWWAPAAPSVLRTGDDGTDGRASSCIYYLLDGARPVNVWHWLASDDVHVLIEGGPVDYVLLPDGLPARRERLGRDLAAGQRPIVAAPAGCWKALRLVAGAGYAVIGSTVSPAWSPDRVRIGMPDHVRDARIDTEPWLTSALVDVLAHDHRA